MIRIRILFELLRWSIMLVAVAATLFINIGILVRSMHWYYITDVLAVRGQSDLSRRLIVILKYMHNRLNRLSYFDLAVWTLKLIHCLVWSKCLHRKLIAKSQVLLHGRSRLDLILVVALSPLVNRHLLIMQVLRRRGIGRILLWLFMLRDGRCRGRLVWLYDALAGHHGRFLELF